MNHRDVRIGTLALRFENPGHQEHRIDAIARRAAELLAELAWGLPPCDLPAVTAPPLDVDLAQADTEEVATRIARACADAIAAMAERRESWRH